MFFSQDFLLVSLSHGPIDKVVVLISAPNHFRLYRFISTERLDFYMLVNLSTAISDFLMRISTSLSVDEILLLRYANWFGKGGNSLIRT